MNSVITAVHACEGNRVGLIPMASMSMSRVVLFTACIQTLLQPSMLQTCLNDRVRLTDGIIMTCGNRNDACDGMVEFCQGRRWRSICNVTWGVEEARAVCLGLRLPSQGKTNYYTR